MKWMDKYYLYRRIKIWNEWINIEYIGDWKDEMNG